MKLLLSVYDEIVLTQDFQMGLKNPKKENQSEKKQSPGTLGSQAPWNPGTSQVVCERAGWIIRPTSYPAKSLSDRSAIRPIGYPTGYQFPVSDQFPTGFRLPFFCFRRFLVPFVFGLLVFSAICFPFRENPLWQLFHC